MANCVIVVDGVSYHFTTLDPKLRTGINDITMANSGEIRSEKHMARHDKAGSNLVTHDPKIDSDSLKICMDLARFLDYFWFAKWAHER